MVLLDAERKYCFDTKMNQPAESTTTSQQLRRRLANVQFTQLLRCLQLECKSQIGEEFRIDRQPIRLVPTVEPSFAANELASWHEPATGRSRPTLEVNFFGLFGPSGALPNHYTQLIQERLRKKDAALSEFLNIFNHRILCMFYRAWEKHAFAVSMETATAAKKESTVTKALWAIVGHRLETSRNRLSFEDTTTLFYGGLFATERPSQESVRACVADFTALPTQVENLVGQWLRLAPEDQSRFPFPEEGELGLSAGNRLGMDTIVGERFWHVENRFRVRIGPVGWEELNAYLPIANPLRQVNDLVRRLVGPQWDFDFQFVVLANEVIGVQLDPKQPFLLGWNTWLADDHRSEDAEESIFELPDVPVPTPPL